MYSETGNINLQKSESINLHHPTLNHASHRQSIRRFSRKWSTPVHTLSNTAHF